MIRIVLATIVVGSLVVGTVSGAADPTRRDAARMQAKIDRISKNGSAAKGAATRTEITETELNSYLRFELGDTLPPGVKEPTVSLPGENRIAGRAVVDLDQVAKSRKSGGMLDPFSYLGGSYPLLVNGTLKTRNGVGTFALESATISGMPVPAWMLQEIVSYYSKSSKAPQGVSLEKPFSLPVGIREIQLGRGQAIVVQ
jgi:hypothetical protein